LRVVCDIGPRKSPNYDKLWRLKRYSYIILAQAKSRAKRDGLEFSLKEEDIIIPTHCPILGIPIKRNIGSGFHKDSPSLDRIDNTKGYTKNNIRIISNRANLLKCDATLEELELLIKDARLHRY